MNFLTRAYRKLVHFFPTMLPQGMTAFNNFADDIIQTYQFPDNDSVRFVLATLLINYDIQKTPFVSVRYFANMIRVAAAKQVASQAFHDIKERDLAAKEADAKAKQAAASTPAAVIPIKSGSTEAPAPATNGGADGSKQS